MNKLSSMLGSQQTSLSSSSSIKSLKENENSYGAINFVDFKPINDADLLLDECEKFISEAKQTQVALPFQAFVKWRAKRRDERLGTLYEILTPRIASSEKALRNIIAEVVNKKEGLRLQARHLQKRLDACIQFNLNKISNIDDPINQLRVMVNNVSTISLTVKAMVAFNNEILRQQNVEKLQKGQTIMTWGGRSRSGNVPVSESDFTNDPDHGILMERLRALRELREEYVKVLQGVLMQKETCMSNLENCQESHSLLLTLLKRDVEEIHIDIEFDHSRCTDCSYGHAITIDCTDHLAMLQTQSSEANKRLQMLVEVREKMRALATLMELLDENGNLGYGYADVNLGVGGDDNSDGNGNGYDPKDSSNNNKNSNLERISINSYNSSSSNGGSNSNSNSPANVDRNPATPNIATSSKDDGDGNGNSSSGSGSASSYNNGNSGNNHNSNINSGVTSSAARRPDSYPREPPPPLHLL